LVNQSKLDFDIINNKPNGKGWNLFANQFAENNYVGWGEYHNSPLISILAIEVLQIAAKNKYNIWCIQIGKYAAKDLNNNRSNIIMSVNCWHSQLFQYFTFKSVIL
jgi:hypothetical protein